MGNPSTFSTLASALKERYAATHEDVTYPESPIYSRVRKEKNWGGKTKKYPIIYGHNQSTSATFTEAQNNADGLKVQAWDMDVSNNRKLYVTAKIPGDLIRAMKGNEKAFFPAVTAEVDSAFKSATRRYALTIARDGWGNLGRMSNAAAASNIVTLTLEGEASNFEVDMKLEFAADNDSGAKRAGVAFVKAVDEDNNQIHLKDAAGADVNTNAVAGLAQNDYIFPAGDRHATAANRLLLAGREAWVPYDRTLVTATPFFGVNRLLHQRRLAGNFLDGTQMRLKEAIVKSAVKAAVQGKPDAAYCDWTKWYQLEMELGSSVVYEDVEVANTGFRSIVINGPKGKINVFPDVGMPSDRLHVVTESTWTLLSLGEPIGFLDEDENQMLRLSTEDKYEIRIGGYTELLCDSPVQNCTTKW